MKEKNKTDLIILNMLYIFTNVYDKSKANNMFL